MISLKNWQQSIVIKLLLTVGVTLLLSISIWAYFSIKDQKKKFMEESIAGADRLTNTIKLGTHYAMMLNSRDDINQIITNIARQKEIESIRVYNKAGQIKYSNNAVEVNRTTNIKDEACYICHRSNPPLNKLALSERTRIFNSQAGYRMLGVISPIFNEPGCSSGACHFHPSEKVILGALDVVISLQETDREIGSLEIGIIGFAVFVLLLTSFIITIFVIKFIVRPVRRLIEGTDRIAKGDYLSKVEIGQHDEMEQLAHAINQMGEEINEKQTQLNTQRDEYQNLFEAVPCIITVQDKNYKLLRYNHEFAEKFNPKPNDYCFHAYKGRSSRCENCPVEKTFEDGMPHHGEESGVGKDGTRTHWIVSTSPIKDAKGDIVAVLEMNLDITHRIQLEDELEKSERKYHAIFNNIPNPVFVLDMDSLDVLDCNESVKSVYEYSKEDILNKSFMEIFEEDDRDHYAFKLKTSNFINQVKHINKEGDYLYVNIRVSPSEYFNQKVLLVTTSDITKRLETEQQLIQTSKMATLGEMATGVAHELNQPLSVIKTASRFLIKKISKKETVEEDILLTMSSKIDSNVDRASKIINHMRQFARKSDMDLEPVDINMVLENAFEIFSQQLKLRGIKVVWDITDNLPKVMGDPSRLEQVFINFLLNARDAIEELEGKINGQDYEHRRLMEKKIYLRTRCKNKTVVVEIEDTGKGIPTGIQNKIFEPFFTTKEVSKGTGLGLSISYGIIKDCGGTIQVRSSEGKGATFIIQFTIQDTD